MLRFDAPFALFDVWWWWWQVVPPQLQVIHVANMREAVKAAFGRL